MNRIIALAGSTRLKSYNKMLLTEAIMGAKRNAMPVTVIDLHEYNLPLYNADLEANEGIPENAKKLMEIFLSHQGLLLALPEYNSSMSAVFKNAIDWVSRPMTGQKELACFDGKIAALISTSTGALGGMRGLVHARAMLENIHVLVLPEQVCVPKADDAFDSVGILKDDKIRLLVHDLGTKLADTIDKINNK